MKNILVQERNHNRVPYKVPHPFLYIATLPLLPLLIALLPCLAIYKLLIRIILIARHGHKFGGFFSSADQIWTYDDDNWKSIVNALFFLECDEEVDLQKIVRLRTKQKVFDVDDYPKLKATMHRFWGFPYLIKNDYSLHECVKLMKVPGDKPFDQVVMRDVLSKVSNQQLPRNGKALWEILLSDRPLIKKADEKYVYPAIARFNHAVGDGASLVSFFMKVYSDTAAEQYLKDALKRYSGYLNASPKKFDLALLVEFSKSALHCLFLISALLPYYIYTFVVKDGDQNPLYGPDLCGEKNAVWSCEDYQELVPMVKKIKNRLPNVTFFDVICTATSCSLTDYFKRKGFDIPHELNVAIPHILSLRNMLDPGPAKLQNRFTIAPQTIPTTRSSLIETLLEMKEHSVIMRSRPDLELGFWILELLIGLCPAILMRFVATFPGVTAALTNVPGTGSVSYFQTDLKDVVFYAPNRKKTGFTISVLTYDNRFQIGLQVDQALISSIEETQRIADDVFKYIRLLDVESSSM
ncbi:uncharacterized protein LOC132707709 isoform X2 [Cylas formicarius]|uniref:uncharacterized protein LOC132707709 isoform X2 n=1 Tax=Cylas formicarius TaxID=197179 RepID=UPI002958C04C|nr:uncharacterized protein LOC132707709 isoform X2 [Cylas formicarius]